MPLVSFPNAGSVLVEPVVLRLLKLGFYLVVGILTSRMGYPGWRFLGPGPQQYEEPLLRP